jgi:hypothetical protein
MTSDLLCKDALLSILDNYVVYASLMYRFILPIFKKKLMVAKSLKISTVFCIYYTKYIHKVFF